MRVLVCGSRTYDDQYKIFYQLDVERKGLVTLGSDITLLIEGGAPGADIIARQWAEYNGIPVQTYLAEWAKYGKSAGPIRNQRMLEEGSPDIVIAFTDKLLSESKGTADMVRRAVDAGHIIVKLYYPGGMNLMSKT